MVCNRSGRIIDNSMHCYMTHLVIQYQNYTMKLKLHPLQLDQLILVNTIVYALTLFVH